MRIIISGFIVLSCFVSYSQKEMGDKVIIIKD